MQAKKLSRRDFLRMSALTAAGAVVASCAPSTPEVVEKEVTREVEKVVTATPAPKGPVTIKLYNPMDPAVFTPYGIDLVHENYPDINLEIIYEVGGAAGWEGTAENLITMIAGGEVIDVIGMATEGIAIMATANVLRDLGAFMDADPEAKSDFEGDMHPTLMKGMQWNGKQYLLPYGWNNMIMYYKPTLFDELGVPYPSDPWSWEDFTEVCKAVSDVKGTEDDRFAFVVPSGGAFSMAPWFFNNGTSWLTEDWMDSNLDDPKAAETLQFLADLILVHKTSPSPFGFDTSGNFMAGHVAMLACGGWCIGGFKSQDYFDFDFDYYPHKAGKLKTVIGMGGYSIATMTPNPEEAWSVVKVILSPEGQIQYTTIDGSPPARNSIAASDVFMTRAEPSKADMGIFYESLEYAGVVPSPANASYVSEIMDRYYSQIWNGEIGVEEAVAAAHEELQTEMDRMKVDMGI